MAGKSKRKARETRKEELLGLLLILLGVLVLLSLLSYQSGDWPNSSSRLEVKNWLGLVGAWISFYLYNFTIGYSVLVVPFLIIYLGWTVLKKGSFLLLTRRAGYMLFFAFCFSIAFALPRTFMEGAADINYEFNGMIGLFFAQLLHRYLGSIGSVLVLFTVMILAFLSITEITITGLLFRMVDEFNQMRGRLVQAWQKFQRQRQLKKSLRHKQHVLRSGPRPEDREEEISPVPSSFVGTGDERYAGVEISREEAMKEEVTTRRNGGEGRTEISFDMPEEEGPIVSPLEKKATREASRKQALRFEVTTVPGDYRLPGIDLLDKPAEVDSQQRRSQLLQEARTLEEKLAIYGIEARVVQIHPGPLITQFEVEPGVGVKINKFFGIADDLAMVMRAKQIRILAPVPGKAVVGIEIPNRNPEIISFRRVIDSEQFRFSKYKLPIALGVDTTGRVYLADMVRMPHLLVAGSTGSGKSVCLNTIIASFLYRFTPEDLRLILIDPKKLELSNYADLRNHHLITVPEMNEEVITTAENAISILGRVWQEMEVRFNRLAKANVRTLEDYNQKVEDGEFRERHPEFGKLPNIVVVIDELADLLMVSGQEVEEPIGRLAHKARAVGIHLIVATQRPSTDVITGAIKANFPCRIAFKVFSKTDSRVVLDRNGAEKLLGRGDMLFQPTGQPTPIRLHSPLITPEEINRIIQFIAEQPPFPEYHLPDPLTATLVEIPDGHKLTAQRDPLFYEALKLVVRHQQGSISLLQRRMRIGYARAARIIDELEQAGFVGAYDGSKAREVLIDEDELENMGVL